jgi:diguanylate cyclase (GGDEF)-like protein
MTSILIVEDDLDMNALMALTLRLENYQVLQAYSGAQALHMAAADRPDLVLMDVVMPGMTGYEAARTLHEDPVTTDIPVIFVTAKQDVEDLVQGLQWAVDYISKPFAMPEMLARVRAALRMKRLQEELRAKNEQLARLAVTDPLTGLLNRRGFNPHLEDELYRVQRFEQPIAVTVFDLDRFKQVNDTWGHAQGDRVLEEFAQVLAHSSRRIDKLARLGGEEFAVLLPGADEEGARHFAEKVRSATAALEMPLIEGEGTLSVTVSGGAAIAESIPRECKQMTVLGAYLLQVADAALYEAKRTGRNRVLAQSVPAARLQKLAGALDDVGSGVALSEAVVGSDAADGRAAAQPSDKPILATL